jgi:frataxin-like iron-binding protein CyaY
MSELYCKTCNKSFVRKHAYANHILCCPKLFDLNTVEDMELPSRLQMYHMIIELNKKCKKMENEIKSLQIKKKEEPLNDFEKDVCNIVSFTTIGNHIDDIIDNRDLNLLFDTDLITVVKNIFSKINEKYTSFTKPWISKKGFYTFSHTESKWVKEKSELKKLFNIIHKKIIEQFDNWCRDNESIMNQDNIAKKYNNTVVKILGGSDDNSLDIIFNKLLAFIGKTN